MDLAKGSADIVITNINFLHRIGNAEVIQPNHEFQFCTGKGERGFGTFGSPVVDGKTPGLGTERTVKDGPRVFVEGVKVDDALRGDMAVEEERDELLVKEERVALLVVFDEGLVGFLRLKGHGRVVAIIVKGLEVGFRGRNVTMGGDAMIKNTGQITEEIRRG